MATPTDVVLAGTKAFALALFAPLTERLGTRPRIAPEPQQAVALCGTSAGLLVVEYGPAWLPALTQLRQRAAGLRIVAALPAGLEAAALALEPLGIEVVPGEGQPAPVLAAVGRALQPGVAAPAAPPPAAPPPAAGRPAAPAAPVAPRVAATPVLGAPPLASPPAPRPAGPAAPRVAVTPVLGTPPVAAPPAAPPAATRPPGPPPAPPRPAVPPAAVRPAAASPPPAAPPAVPAAADAPLDLFADLGGTEATPTPGTLPAVDPFAAAAAGAASLYVPPLRGAAAVWPATAPSPAEAAQALVAALDGRLDERSPLKGLADQAVAAMSDLERGVLAGAGAPFDEAPIRAAAVLRLRIATAIATRPPIGSPVDQPAVEGLLAELDAALSAVNALLPGAPEALRPPLEAVRNALVKEAVDFSESCHTGALQLPPAPPRSTGARLISMAASAAEKPETRRGIFVLLAVAALAAGGYHGWRYWKLQQLLAAQRAATLPGGPAGMTAAPGPAGGPVLLVPVAGEQPDRADVDRWKKQEEAKGNKVIERDGTLMVVPGQPQEPAKP